MDIKATWNENTKKSRFPDQLWTLVSFVMLASNSTFWVVISSIIQGVWKIFMMYQVVGELKFSGTAENEVGFLTWNPWEHF